MKDYDVVKYWNERGNPCSNSIDELTNDHLAFLKYNVKGCKNVLDFGPGYGRLFSAYEAGTNIVGVDVTEQYKEKLQHNAQEQNVNFELICKQDVLKPFDFDDKYFDAVVTSEVLFHQTPNTIRQIMLELNRVAKKVIVISYMNLKEKYDALNGEFDKSRYCFNYNYYKIAAKNNLLIYNEKRLRNQLMFVYSDCFSFNYNGENIFFSFDNKDYYMPQLIMKSKNFYEVTYLEYLKNKGILKADDDVVEIGAYLGNHTLYFSKIIGCNVHTFEPTKSSYNVVLNNLKMNYVSNVMVYNKAAAAKNGFMRMKTRDIKNPGANQFIYTDSGDFECVRTDSIDFENVDFIKIDAEGGEFEALKGCQGLIDKFKPIIMIEVESDNMKSVQQWMKINKYKRFGVDVFKKNVLLLRGI